MNITPKIIDANIPCQAGKSTALLTNEEAECAIICSEFISQLISNHNSRLVLDDNFRILHEYDKVCAVNKRTEPNITTVFRKWAYQYFVRNFASNDIVQLHELSENEYVEYPTGSEFSSFDRNDRKYVAVSNAHPEHPHIYNAMDTDWCQIDKPLKSLGIKVEFICPRYIQRHLKAK